MFTAIDISTSALVAQRTNLDVISGNLANAYTPRGADGSAYRRRFAVFAEGNPAAGKGAPGVHIQSVEQDPSALRKEHNPSHPDAVKSGPDKGYVYMPNVNPAEEIVNGMMATRAYEANVAVMDISKSMMAASLRLLA